MELAFNLAWLGIAAAALCLLATTYRARPRAAMLRDSLLVLCALLLLFPSISLTDDLHSGFSLLEESSLQARSAATQVEGPAIIRFSVFVPVAAGALAPSLVVMHEVVLHYPRAAFSVVPVQPPLRSPPAPEHQWC